MYSVKPLCAQKQQKQHKKQHKNSGVTVTPLDQVWTRNKKHCAGFVVRAVCFLPY